MKSQEIIRKTELNRKQFYKESGHLLYAVAYSDGKACKKEADELNEFVLKEFVPLEPTSDLSGILKHFTLSLNFRAWLIQIYQHRKSFNPLCNT